MRYNIAAAAALLIMAAAGPLYAQAGRSSGAPTATAPSTATQQYIGKAAIGDRFEIESSRLAQSESKNERLQEFARMMVEDHGRLSTKLQQAVQEAGLAVTPPTELDDAHDDMIDQLRDAEGTEFDRLYIDMQMKAHQEALQLHSDYAKNGDTPRLKTAASEAAPIVQRHLDHLKQIPKP